MHQRDRRNVSCENTWQPWYRHRQPWIQRTLTSFRSFSAAIILPSCAASAEYVLSRFSSMWCGGLKWLAGYPLLYLSPLPFCLTKTPDQTTNPMLQNAAGAISRVANRITCRQFRELNIISYHLLTADCSFFHIPWLFIPYACLIPLKILWQHSRPVRYLLAFFSGGETWILLSLTK